MSEIADKIEEMRMAPSSTPEEQRKRCPECLSTGIRRKTGKPTGGPTKDGRYYCRGCCTHFDDPVVGVKP